MTIDEEVLFWDAVLGTRAKHVFIDPSDLGVPVKFPSIPHSYKVIDCLFNHENVYANVQQDNRVPLVNFEIKNPRFWKSMDPAAVSALHYSRPFAHSPRLLKISQYVGNPVAQAHTLESEL